MTKYLQPSFSVHAPGSQEYRDNWDAIFAPKSAPESPKPMTLREKARSIAEEILEAGEDYSDCYDQEDRESTLDYCEHEIMRLTSSSIRNQVEEFHRSFGHPVVQTPTVPSVDRVKLRLRLITEEYIELLESTGPLSPIVKEQLFGFCDAYREPYTVDLTEFADACADLDYVVEGARLEFGIDGAPIAAEVHRSNMSKKFGTEVRRNEHGKIMKSPDYSPADVSGELKKQGWNG